MVINVAEALCSDTAKTITVERPGLGSHVNGLWVPAEASKFKTLASVQFPTGKQLQDLPESQRTQETILVISIKEIRASQDQDGTSSDRVLYDGKRYKVILCRPWGCYGYTYSIAVRERRTA